MGTAIKKYLKKIDPKLQVEALRWVNAVRQYLGAPSLKKLPIEDAENSVCGSPIAKAILGLFADDPAWPHDGFPDGYPGNIKKDVGSFHCSVWEVSNQTIGKDLAKIFGTEYKSMRKTDYCCHRHFGEEEMVVVLPKSLAEYEEAVVNAADEASRCDDCGRRWFD